ncbi:MAG: hypothetical protein CO133_02810 [Candidatus Komeilibacteria bacterium CG_4_9_14_3_um_filter_37_5]|nr:MAG: hypothetical protein CO133_02810 [Candidatus Komeilibacteria bacterium CG_4_9_14_3_um_filter_37_5]
MNVYAIGKNATVELVKKKNRNYLQLKIQQETIIEISDMCIMFCNQPATSQALYDQVQIMAELIALVEKDLIFIGSELIQLNIFTPFIALSAPQLFEKTFLANLAELSEELNRGVIPSALRETRKSRMYHQQDGDRRYLLDKQYYDEHIEYVIYLPTERSLLIRFSLQFDREEINTLLAEKQFRSYPIKTKHQDKFVIKKGGSSRGVNRVFTRTNWQVFDQDRLVLTLCGKDTVLLPLDNIAAALELFADIYYRRMFISSWLPSAEVPCDLTDYERQVIKNMKNLFLIYNFFVKPVLDKEFSEAAQRIVFLESQEEDPEPQLAYEWLYQQLNSIKEDDYFEKFHCLLLAINEVVDQQMPIMMRLSAMQCDRALELQSRLLKMIGVSQVFLNSYKRQELLLV